MNFHQALRLLVEGKRVRRRIWDDHVYLQLLSQHRQVIVFLGASWNGAWTPYWGDLIEDTDDWEVYYTLGEEILVETAPVDVPNVWKRLVTQ